MARYRRHPTRADRRAGVTPPVIEAEQFLDPAKPVAGMCVLASCPHRFPHVHSTPVEGPLKADPVVEVTSGFFVVPEPDGAGYLSFSPEIFAARFEPVAS